jgi:hypothetical protein
VGGWRLASRLSRESHRWTRATRAVERGGHLGEKAMRFTVVHEEAGLLRVPPVKNKKDFKIQLRIFQTTQNRK